MFGHRHRQHAHSQPPAPTNPYALAAARASTPNPRAQTPTLSQSAAAAALHSTPITHTPPANLVTKRMERRNSQTSLQRRGSESSMSERIGWLRESASPERRPESRDSYTPSRPKSMSTSRASRGGRDEGGASSSVRKSNSRHGGLAQSMHAPQRSPSVTLSPQKNKPASSRANTRQSQQAQHRGYDDVPDARGHRGVEYDDDYDSGDAASPTVLPSTMRGNAGLKTSMHAPQNTNRSRKQQQQQQQQQSANSQNFSSRLKAGTMRTSGGMDYDNQYTHQQQHHTSDFRANGSYSAAPAQHAASSSGVPDVSEQAKVLAREIMRQQMLLEQRKKAAGESTPTTSTTAQTTKKKKKSKGKRTSQGSDDDLGQLDTMDPHYAASVSSVGSWASDLQSIPEERNDIHDREGRGKTLRKRRGRGTFTDRVTPGREGVPDLPTIPSLGDLEDDNQKKRQETFDQMAVEQRPYRTGSNAKKAAKQQQQQKTTNDRGVNQIQASQKVSAPSKANEKKALEHPTEQVPSPPDSPSMTSRPFIRTIPATPPAANMENPIVSPPTSTSETEGTGGLHVKGKRSVDHHSPSRGGSLSLKHHSPPLRSLSPVKSALKGGSSGSLSNHGEMSDNSSILSTEDGNRRRSASRKRNIRVSFSEENDVVEMPEDEYLYSPIKQEHDGHKKYSAVKADDKSGAIEADEAPRKGNRDVSFSRVNRASDTHSDNQIAKEDLEQDSEPYQVSDLDSEDDKPVQKPTSAKGIAGDIETTESPSIGKVEAPQPAPAVHLNNGAASAALDSSNTQNVNATRSSTEPNIKESKQKLFGGLLDMPGLFPGTPMEIGTPPTEYPLGDATHFTSPPPPSDSTAAAVTSTATSQLAPVVDLSSHAPSTPESHADEDSDSGDSIYSDAFEAFGTGPASPKRREGKRTISTDSSGMIAHSTTAAANGGGVMLSTSDEEEPYKAQNMQKTQKPQKTRQKALREDINGKASHEPQHSQTSRPSEMLRRTVSNSSSSSASSRVSGSSFRREFPGGGGRGTKGVSKLRTSMREPGAAESRTANGANKGEVFSGFKKGAGASRWADSTNSTPEKADRSSFQSGFRGRDSGAQSKGLFGMRRGSKQREYSPDSSDNETRRKSGKASLKKTSNESRSFFGRSSMRTSMHAPTGNDSSRKQTGGWQSRFADSSDEEGEDLVARRNRLGRTLSPDSSTSSLGNGHTGRDNMQFRHLGANTSSTDPNIGKSGSKKRWWNLGSKKGKQSKDAARPLSAGAPQATDLSERPALGKRRETDPETSGWKGSSSRNSFRLSGRLSFDKQGRGGGEGGEPHTARMDRLDEENEEFPGGEQFYTDKKPKKFPKLRKMFGIKD